MVCTFNLNATLQNENTIVVYSDEVKTVYLHNGFLNVSNCKGEILIQGIAPVDYREFDVVSVLDRIVINFSGAALFVIDLVSQSMFCEHLTELTIGKCISSILVLNDSEIVFVTKLRNQIQLVKYDIINRKRVQQSASRHNSSCQSIKLYNNKIYTLIDESLIIEYDSNTLLPSGNSRFEAGRVSGSIYPTDRGLIYVSTGMLCTLDYNFKDIEKKKMLLNVEDVLHVDESTVYCSSEKNIVAIESVSGKQKWAIGIGGKPVEAMFIRSEGLPVLLVQIESGLVFVELKDGHVLRHLPIDQLSQIKLTPPHLVILRKNGISDVLMGTF